MNAKSPSILAESTIQNDMNKTVIPISQTRKSMRNALCKVVDRIIVDVEVIVPFRIHAAP